MNAYPDQVCIIVTPDRDGHYDIDGVSLDSKEGVVVGSDARYNLPNLVHIFLVPSTQWRAILGSYMERASA